MEIMQTGEKGGGGAIARDQHIVDPSLILLVVLYCIVKSNKEGFIWAAYLIIVMISWISLFQDYDWRSPFVVICL